jgi:hypothetical protein
VRHAQQLFIFLTTRTSKHTDKVRESLWRHREFFVLVRDK